MTLHDIGKIGVPDLILNKPGRLNDDEMTVIKNHPITSGHIIESTSLKDIAGIIRLITNDGMDSATQTV